MLPAFRRPASRFFPALTFGLCIAAALSAGVRAAEETAATAALPFPMRATWDIGVSRVHPSPEGPRRIEVFGQAFWVVPYSFEPIATQDGLAGAMDLAATETEDANLKTLYAEQAERLRAEAARPRHAHPRLTLEIPGQPAFVDLADDGIRNFFERQTRRHFLTANELAAIDLADPAVRDWFARGGADDLPREDDGSALARLRPRIDDSGRLRRRVVDMLAIFPAPERWPETFRLRLSGLGHNMNPGFEPGELLFWDLYYVEDPARPGATAVYNPSLRKVLYFDYVHPENATRRDDYSLAGKSEGWSWLWTQNIYAASPRRLSVSRPSGQERQLLYVPYKFWNNTGRDQKLTVREAGLAVPFSWQGIKATAYFGDRPERRDYWYTLAQREIERRVAEGEEEEIVAAADVERDPTLDLAADLAAKADILPPEGSDRHPVDLRLDSQMRTQGIMLLFPELDNLDAIVEQLRCELAARALLGRDAAGAAEEGGLFSAYMELVTRMKADDPLLARVAAATILPEKDLVWRRMLRVAAAELAERGKSPSTAEALKYNRHEFVRIVPEDILDWEALANAFADGREIAGPAAKVAARLSEVAKANLRKGARGTKTEQLVAIDALNRALERADLFSAADFDAVELDAEGKDMARRGFDFPREKLVNLLPLEIFKLNRLTLDRLADGALRPCLDWAMLGCRLNAEALAALDGRVGRGVVDVFFDTEINGAGERAELSLPYQELLPPEFPPYLPPAETDEAALIR